MYKLYWAPNTGAFAPEVVMALAGVPFENIRVDYDAKEQQGEAYRKLNPMGQIPLLILPEGQVMTESAAMVLHLVDRFPAAGLAPLPGTPERAVFDRWLVFLAVNLYTADLRYYYPERYSTDPTAAAGVKAAADPGPFLQGARYGAADLYLLMLADWYPPARDLPRLRQLCDALEGAPGVAAVHQRYVRA
jgi:glutathione S-transferase